MRIAVSGPQNTGKSTFIADCLTELPEYSTPRKSYRDVIRNQALAVNQLTSQASQQLIRDFMVNQLQKEKSANVLFDRCLIDNYVYSLGAARQQIGQSFLDESLELTRQSLSNLDVVIFIPTAVSVTLTPDQLRDIDTSYIDRINRLFLEVIMDYVHGRLPVWIVSGDRQERVRQVKARLAASKI